MAMTIATGSLQSDAGIAAPPCDGLFLASPTNQPSKNPQAAADGPHMAKAAAACGVLRAQGCRIPVNGLSLPLTHK